MLTLLRLPFGTWTSTFLSVALVSGLPLLVTLLMARQEALLRRWLPHMTAFGSGTVFAAAVGHLIPESLRMGQSWLAVATGVVAGYAAFALIERALAGHDHAHAHGVPLGAPSAHDSEASEAECVHLHPTPISHPAVHASRALAPMAFFGDAVHNFVDGALIAAGFLAEPTVGILTLIAVGLHELPREVGTFALFVHGGIRPMRAVMYNLITAGVAMVGAGLTLLIGHRMANLTTLLLPFAAGTYLYIAQVVGRSALHDRHDDPTHWGRLAWSGVGAALVLALAIGG
ncbi:MAG: ZIP family metal transporter [Gemmatimonadaceae bacterium]|nr:ZIP family metal transporter [Gemmatimonadaceae bacterium]